MRGAVGHITLNRPDVYNAITIELARALDDALSELATKVSVIVIRGAGGNFCVGGDFEELGRLRTEGEQAMRELFVSFGSACATIADVPVPVVAAVEGYAMAGGFELMQACDVALVRDDAKIADNHSNFGMVPGGGSSQRLPRLVGRQRALGLILSGDRLTGIQAAAWGLAYRALPEDGFEVAVEGFADQLAAKDPAALRQIKRLVRDGDDMSLSDALDLELNTVLEHLQGEGAGGGIDSFARRRST
jgi:enoyl-CoA hydratase/carnithine racemase